MVAADDPNPRWSTTDPAFVGAASELLEAGQYEHLAELLHRVQLAYDKEGDTIPAHVLVLARRICLACSHKEQRISPRAYPKSRPCCGIAAW